MTWSLRRAALVAAAALMGAAPASAQAEAGTPTAPTVRSERSLETAAPRRRPVPRTQRPARRPAAERPVEAFQPRLEPTPPGEPIVPVAPVADRASAVSASIWASGVDIKLREAAPEWIGIPYRWGGTTRRGIDCSAFVQQFVAQQFGHDLSRTTATQQYEGTAIDRSELRAGDLVFFRRRGVRHVGVYLSDGEFIHASSSRGVTISTMESGYWARHYWMSRRILPGPSRAVPATPGVRRDSSAGAIG